MAESRNDAGTYPDQHEQEAQAAEDDGTPLRLGNSVPVHPEEYAPGGFVDLHPGMVTSVSPSLMAGRRCLVRGKWTSVRTAYTSDIPTPCSNANTNNVNINTNTRANTITNDTGSTNANANDTGSMHV